MLEEAGIEEAGSDAWLLFSEAFHMSRAQYYMDMNRACDPEKRIQYENWLKLRAQRIPLQHITGHAPFMGYEFYVNEHVLTPRADTEVLVEKTFEAVKAIDGRNKNGAGLDRPVKILDMCTGSGCIAVSLACMAGEQGPAHDKTFLAEVLLNGAVIGSGGGHSKKEAEQSAARAALAQLT